jgi:hypothetical protein
MGSPNATIPLHRPCESRKGKFPTFKLVIRLTLKPCPFSVRSTLGIHSSRLWNLVGPLMSPSSESLPHAMPSFLLHSRSSSHADRTHLSGFLQLSDAHGHCAPDCTGLQRWEFSIAPTSVPGNFFRILFTHGVDSSFDS